MIDTEAKNLRYKNILAVPSIHSRAYFALAAREAYQKYKPTVVVLEHPNCYTQVLREAVSRLPNVSVIINVIGDEAIYIPIDPCDSIIEGMRLAIEEETPFICIDKDISKFPSNSKYIMPDDYALSRIGLSSFCDEVFKRHNFIKNDDDTEREKFMAANLLEISKNYERVLFICGLSHWQNIARFIKEGVLKEEDEQTEGQTNIFTVHKDSLQSILGETPFTTYFYEMFRNGEADDFDKLKIVETIYKEAKLRYRMPIHIMQQKRIGDYLRNLSVLEGNITPDRIDILTAAKCMVNNDYALEVMDGMEYYPYYDDSDEKYPVIKMEHDPETSKLQTYLRNKKITLKRYDNVWKTSLKKVSVTTRPKEEFEGQWLDVWNKSSNMLSHIPEDLLMERYMNIMRDKIVLMMTEDKIKITPFMSSIKDGIDMRETIRNYHKNEIYVREVPKLKGDIGHMVVIFDDEHDEDYTWQIVWYSEAHDDSDLILYATEPGLELIGPGISKSYFGGYASLMPPQGPHNVWAEYEILKMNETVTKYSELLLYSAIHYSVDRYLGYIAPNPPSEVLKRFAHKKGVEIIYVALNSFSSDTVNKLRHFHVLGDKRLRTIADRYII